MSRFVKVLPALLAAAMFSASCGNNVKIEGVVAQVPSSELIVKVLDGNKMTVADTIATDEKGKFSYGLTLEKGQPEFVYIFNGENRIASLLLQKGDKVKVNADTLGNYSVDGSDETVKLIAVEKEFADAQKQMDNLLEQYASLKSGSKEAVEINRQITQAYISYYRKSVKYVMENCHSLTVVPVFYQKFGANLPVFGQTTDAMHFNAVCDSLESVYPDSKYVKALRKEAQTRIGYLELESRIKNAPEIGFPDIELPDIEAKKVKLSEVDAKVVMIQFWSAGESAQKMFNLDVLKPIYNEYHQRGFEIYQISLDVDKPMWASVVKEQKIPWISVSDSRGMNSPFIRAYNIPAIPATYIVCNGELVDGKVVDSKSLRKLLDKLLK